MDITKRGMWLCHECYVTDKDWVPALHSPGQIGKPQDFCRDRRSEAQYLLPTASKSVSPPLHGSLSGTLLYQHCTGNKNQQASLYTQSFAVNVAVSNSDYAAKDDIMINE
jgi:hypothetical protein